MDSIFELLTLLINISVVGGFIMLTLKILKFRKKSGLKNEIDNLQAQISLLRISLKSKVKRKSFALRAQFPKSLSPADPANLTLNELIENKLETGADFQSYFDGSRKINSLIALSVENYAPAEDFMSNDFNNEISIIKLIKDICSLSSRLNKKIELFNIANPNAVIQPVDNLIFQSMVEVNRIFNDNKNVSVEPDLQRKIA